MVLKVEILFSVSMASKAFARSLLSLPLISLSPYLLGQVLCRLYHVRGELRGQRAHPASGCPESSPQSPACRGRGVGRGHCRGGQARERAAATTAAVVVRAARHDDDDERERLSSFPSLAEKERERESTRERKRFFEFCFSASKHEFFFHCSWDSVFRVSLFRQQRLKTNASLTSTLGHRISYFLHSQSVEHIDAYRC